MIGFWVLFISFVAQVGGAICLQGTASYTNGAIGLTSVYEECVYPSGLSEIDSHKSGLRERMIAQALTEDQFISWEVELVDSDETILIWPNFETIRTIQQLDF